MSIAFRRIILPRHHNKISSGASITVLAETVNAQAIDVLANATVPPTLSLYDSLGVQRVFEAVMSNVSIGLYNYTYRTPSDSPLGVYTGNFTAVLENHLARIERIALWKIITTSVLSEITYVVLTDQTGVPWYYYVNVIGDLVGSTTIPNIFLRNASVINTIPTYWIEITNAVSLTRYVWPDIVGGLMVTPTPPPIGTGTTAEFLFIGEDGLDYILTLNIIDDIIPQEVV